MSTHGDLGNEEVVFRHQDVEEVSKAIQVKTENLLNEVNSISPETLKVYLEHLRWKYIKSKYTKVIY